MIGSIENFTLNVNHVGLIVDANLAHRWNTSNTGGGYLNSELHSYLKDTILPLVNTDLGSTHLLGISRLLSNGINTSATNRSVSYTGASSGWDTETNSKICELGEIQVFGTVICGSSFYDVGSESRQLEVFQKYSHTDLFGNRSFWLKDVGSSERAVFANASGFSNIDNVLQARSAIALVLYR